MAKPAPTTAPVLPPARPVLWPLRPPESARSAVTEGDGRVIVTIRHAPLSAVTAEMLTWWYGHVPGTMRYAGGTYPRYLVWHPLDHVSYDLVRPHEQSVGPGSRLHIVEALGRDPHNMIDINVTVEELTHGRAVIAKTLAGTGIVRLENEFEDEPSGVSYVTRMTIGDTTPAGRLILNWIARHKAFPARRIQPWIRHHIEEIGNLEHLLPDLFNARADHE